MRRAAPRGLGSGDRRDTLLPVCAMAARQRRRIAGFPGVLSACQLLPRGPGARSRNRRLSAAEIAVEWLTSAAGIPIPKLLYGTAWKKSATERLVATAIA